MTAPEVSNRIVAGVARLFSRKGLFDFFPGGPSVKFSLLAVLPALLIICVAVSAQEYQIRADANVKLREAFSLEGEVVEIVPAGSILQVVGQFNRWLKIDRSGSTLWMADWVNFSRVGDSDRTQSQIDNCCFVDRQCTVDAEWTSGYLAFQNGQCAAPLQTGLQLPMTSTGAESSEVDNCCFLDWQCSSDAEWERGYRAFQNNQCLHRGLVIEGPEDFVLAIEAALEVLMNRAPQWYAYATGGLDKIRLEPEAPRSAVYVHARTWNLPPRRVNGRHAISMALGMVHEACHVHLYEDGATYYGLEGERACVQMQVEAAAAIDPRDRHGYGSSFRHLLANIDDPAYQWWH